MDDGHPEVCEDLPRLVSELEADDPITRASASRALTEVRTLASPQVLVEALHSGDARLCRWAATALGLRGEADGYDALSELLRSGDADEREAGAFALGLLGDERAVEPLVLALDDSDPHVSQAAALALTRLGDRRGADAAWGRLLSQLAEGDEEERAFAARTLGALSDLRAGDALAGALHDPSADVRADAACALGTCAGPSALEALLDAGFRDPDAQVRDAAMFALARLTGDRGPDAVVA